MALHDRVKTTTLTEGIGDITLSTASRAHQAWSVVGDGVKVPYFIAHQTEDEFETGEGTYTASGNTLSRDTIRESSNSNLIVPFSAGTKDVALDVNAALIVYADPDTGGIVPGNQSITDEVAYYNSAGQIVGGGALHPETVYTSSTTTTTGDAATINITPALSDDTVYRATVKVLARCTTGGGTATTGDVWDAVLYGTFRRVSGTLTRVNWRTVYFAFDEALPANIEVIANDTTKLLQLEVQGFASDTILWEVICELQEVST